MATDYFTMMKDVAGSYGKGVSIARDREYQDEKRARETTEYDQRQAEYTRAQGLQLKVDTAQNNLEALNAGVVEPGATGLSQPSAQMLSRGYGDAKGGQAVQDAAGDYQREANRMGLTTQFNAQAPVTSRKATEREMLDARMGVAVASRDIRSQDAYREQGKELDWTDGRTAQGKVWDAMTDDQKRAKTDELSQSTAIPGSGTWVAGKGKREGYMWFNPPGADPMKLSGKEAKELFTLANLASVNPERARKETEAAGDKVRAVYSTMFEIQTKGVTANNTAQHYLDSANAYARNANTAEANGASSRKLQDLNYNNLVGFNKARAEYQQELDALSPADQKGAPGKALEKAFNVQSLKLGQQIREPGASGARKETVLNDQQTLAYKSVLAMFREDPNMSPAQRDEAYSSVGLNPANFGGGQGQGDLVAQMKAQKAAADLKAAPAAPAAAPRPSLAPPAPQSGLPGSVLVPASRGIQLGNYNSLDAERTPGLTILSTVSGGRFNVGLPDGTTVIMSKSQLESAGYLPR